MRDADDLHVLDRHDFLLAQWADTSHRVLGDPAANLDQSVLLRRIQRLGHFRV